MDGVDFAKFPYHTNYIKGIPIELFESTISGIAVHTLLDNYPRSFSKNENELLQQHSCIADMSNDSDGIPVSYELLQILKRLITIIMIMMEMKLGVNNPFLLRPLLHMSMITRLWKLRTINLQTNHTHLITKYYFSFF